MPELCLRIFWLPGRKEYSPEQSILEQNMLEQSMLEQSMLEGRGGTKQRKTLYREYSRERERILLLLVLLLQKQTENLIEPHLLTLKQAWNQYGQSEERIRSVAEPFRNGQGLCRIECGQSRVGQSRVEQYSVVQCRVRKRVQRVQRKYIETTEQIDYRVQQGRIYSRESTLLYRVEIIQSREKQQMERVRSTEQKEGQRETGV